MNIRENRWGNQEWKIQRSLQHCTHKTQDKTNKAENATHH